MPGKKRSISEVATEGASASTFEKKKLLRKTTTPSSTITESKGKRKASASEPVSTKGRKETTSGATEQGAPAFMSNLQAEGAAVGNGGDEVDFPRGGGTSLTQIEYAEARKEGESEALFQDAGETAAKDADAPKVKRKKIDKGGEKRLSGAGPKGKSKAEHVESFRIEHLSYKRLLPSTKILGQIVSIRPLELVVSLPNQLFGHVPITNISKYLTERLEAAGDLDSDDEGSDEDEEDESEDEEMEGEPTPEGGKKKSSAIPELSDLFKVGQWVRTAVVNVKSSEKGKYRSLAGREGDEKWRASQRVELSLDPKMVNEGVEKRDLEPGFTITASVKSIEDRGYVLDFGLPEMSSFISFPDAKTLRPTGLQIGELVECKISKMQPNKRICTVTIDPQQIKSSTIGGSPSIASVLPGMLVQGLVTAVVPSGSNIRFLGFCDGSVDLFHVGEKAPKKGDKVTGRIIWDMITSSPRKFVLSMLPSIVSLQTEGSGASLHDVYEIGLMVDGVVVVRVEPEWGLVCEFPGVDGNVVPAFVHISRVADTHIATLSSSSGPWKVGTTHRARVTDHSAVDGLVQLSLQPSVLEKNFLRVSDARVGEILKGTIHRLTDTGMFVNISGNVDGVVWPLHYSDIKLKHPEKKFKPGASVKARIFSVDTDKNRITLTLKKTLLNSDLPILTNFSDARVGLETHATVSKFMEKGILVDFFGGIRGFVPVAEAAETYTTDLKSRFNLGQVIKVRIITVKKEDSRLVASVRQALPGAAGRRTETNLNGISRTLSLPANTLTSNISFDALHEGQVLDVRVFGRLNRGLAVQVSRNVRGRISWTDIADDYDRVSSTEPSSGTILKSVIVTLDAANKQVDLASRTSVVARASGEGQMDLDVKDKAVEDLGDIAVGAKIRGIVTNVTDAGVFVALGRSLTARVQIKELFDEFVKDWKPRFRNGQVCEGTILGIDKSNQKVEMSLRKNTGKKTLEPVGLSSLEEGQLINGTVTKMEAYGAFIRIEGSNTSGLCHKSEITDQETSEWRDHVSQGQKVQAVVIKIDHETRKINFSIKPSRIAEASGKAEDAEDAEHAEDDEDVELESVDSEDIEFLLDSAGTATPAVGDENDGFISLDTSKEVNTSVPALPVTAEFVWDARDDVEDDADESDGSEEDEEEDDTDEEEGEGDDVRGVGRGLQKSKSGIAKDETGDLATKAPTTVSDFERLLLGSPNSSFLWIQYMSFYLGSSEVDKARSIAQRALQTINFREEQEKLNIWVALLNLENSFGTDDSMEETFRKAIQANDDKTVYLRTAEIFDKSGKFEKEEDLFKRFVKKFGYSSKAWTLFGQFYLTQGKLSEARELLPRSLKSLPKRKHVKTISKFALSEFKLGDPERGRTIFEGIVDSYPKRIDLWSMYIDQEIKQKNVSGVRALFDRVLQHRLSSKKSKFIFKKWLAFEKDYGDEEGAQAVKERAIAYVESLDAQDED